MPIDIHTVAILLSLSNVMQVLALFTQYRVDKTHGGTGWWTLGTALFALAFVFAFLRDAPGAGPVAIVANNVLFCCGFSFCYVGFRRFVGRPAPSGLLVAFCGAVSLAAFWFTYVDNNLAARRMIISAAIILISTAIIRTLLVNDLGPVARTSRYFLCAVFAAEIALMTANGTMPSASRALFSASLVNVAIYLGSVITTTLWTFGVILMVNQRLVAEREQTIQDLNGAIEQIKTLKGILPICAGCKKIRDDQGYWEQVDSYVSRHSEAEFTHGMCPDCMDALYSGFRRKAMT